MSFPFKDDIPQATAFFHDYLKATQKDPVLFEAWRRLGLWVGIQIEDMGIGFSLDCTHGETIAILNGYPDFTPGVGLKLTSDLFHDLFTGKVNVGVAFAKRQIRAEGNVAGVLKLTALMPKNIKLYKAFLAERGLV